MRKCHYLQSLVCFYGVLSLIFSGGVLQHAQGQEQEQQQTVVPSSSTKFCQRQQEVEDGNRTIDRALEGLEIRMAFFDYQVESEGGELKEDDIAIKFIDRIADLAGFTKWSSNREPAHVFQLLETLYGAFDKIAKRRVVVSTACSRLLGFPVP